MKVTLNSLLSPLRITAKRQEKSSSAPSNASSAATTFDDGVVRYDLARGARV